jgi:hypothetical protein
VNKFKGNKNVSYVCSDKDINIFNSGGRIVYSHPNRRKRLIIFNLPDGLFYTKNKLQTVNKKNNFVPSFQMLFKEYPRQWNFSLPIKGQLTNNFIVGNNPNKASIYPQLHKVIVDKKLFSTLPLPCVKFILFHELGHYFYKEEPLADLFAVVCMLQDGFNYYDCMKTQLHFLNRSQETVKRTLFVYNKLKEYGNK